MSACPTCGQVDCGHLVRVLAAVEEPQINPGNPPLIFTHRFAARGLDETRNAEALWHDAALREGWVAVAEPTVREETIEGHPFVTVEGKVVPRAAEVPVRDTGPDDDEIDNWFTYHPPSNPREIVAYEEIRAGGRLLARQIVELAPPSRERSTALAKVREAVMWANAAVACNRIEDAS
jgi:hypothetical protein